MTSRGQKFTTKDIKEDFDKIKLPDPETGRDMLDVLKGIERALLSISNKLNK